MHPYRCLRCRLIWERSDLSERPCPNCGGDVKLLDTDVTTGDEDVEFPGCKW